MFLYNIIFCKKHEKSRIEKELKDFRTSPGNGTELAPGFDGIKNSQIDQISHNQHPQFYGKQLYGPNRSDQHILKDEDATAEIPIGGEFDPE
jgi:hypothetical protein